MILAALAAACSGPPSPVDVVPPGVVFAYPSNGQLDVPLGTRVAVTFSEAVDASALGTCAGSGASVTGGFCLVGPSGPVDAMPQVTGDGKTVELDAPPLDPGTAYALYVAPALDPQATNIPASAPLVSFTTRSDRPLSAPPALVAVNGNDPAHLGDDALHPLMDTSTLHLLFSEPLDTRTVALAPGAVELVDASGTAVPATLLCDGIHLTIDPENDLTGGAMYQVKLGAAILDTGGQPLPQTSFSFVPHDTRGTTGPIPQVLRTRATGDPGSRSSRTGAMPNVIEMDKPLIGKETSQLQPAVLAGELGDPKALGGPISFTLRKGQRLSASGLDISLGGQIPVGLSTGDIEIELLSDAGGRIYRNPFHDPSQSPDNDNSPLYVDLSMDVAVYAVDPEGNAVLSQTVLGVQASGVVTATDGVLDIETQSSMELGLLGVTKAPSNLVLELITDPSATPGGDTTAPSFVASFPDENGELPVDGGVELIFSEPIDLDRARAGGIQLQTAAGQVVPSVIESHGAAVVVRPTQTLPYSTAYQVVLGDVVDLAGNALATPIGPLDVVTPELVATNAPMSVVAVHPGVACSLTGATASSPGRCAGGQNTDDLYQPFELPANEAIDVHFSAPPDPTTLVLGGCNQGSIRVVQMDDMDKNCIGAVPGTLTHHDLQVDFVPDAPWQPGVHYRLQVISGGNASCDPGETCGSNNVAANYDPLNGTQNGNAGGPDLIEDFIGAPATDATAMFAAAEPYTDINGSGTVDGGQNGEVPRDENRALLHITGTTGSVSSASFTSPDCAGATNGMDACLYVQGGMTAEMEPVASNCTLPDGSTAASCVPVALDPEVMYATSVSMKASVGVSITSNTGTSVMRVRQPAQGPVMAYIFDNNGTPTMIAQLGLYMDAPDMSIPLSSHDLHSKPLTVTLEGPVQFLPDGRIAIAVANTADVPLQVNIKAPFGITGGVKMVIPKGEMKLQLVSPLLRGGRS